MKNLVRRKNRAYVRSILLALTASAGFTAGLAGCATDSALTGESLTQDALIESALLTESVEAVEHTWEISQGATVEIKEDANESTTLVAEFEENANESTTLVAESEEVTYESSTLSTEPTQSDEDSSVTVTELTDYVSEGTPGVVETDTTLYTYNMMATDLDALAKTYPDRLRVSVAGYTADGRALYKAIFGNPQAGRQIFICAATHAREYMTTQLVMKQLERYCQEYDTGIYGNQTFREIFDQTCFVIIPMVNPDGVSISQLGENALRNDNLRANLQAIYQSDLANGFTAESYDAYLVRWKANGRGVDLNRNYSPGWESVADRVAPSSTTYKGEYPGSEAEAQVLMNCIESMTNPQMAISYHSYGDLVYYQYGQEEPLYSANQALAQAICDHTGHYMAGYSNEAGFSNWCNLVKGIRSVTVETGVVPAPLPLDQFSLLWSQHADTWLLLTQL